MTDPVELRILANPKTQNFSYSDNRGNSVSATPSDVLPVIICDGKTQQLDLDKLKSVFQSAIGSVLNNSPDGGALALKGFQSPETGEVSSRMEQFAQSIKQSVKSMDLKVELAEGVTSPLSDACALGLRTGVIAPSPRR